MAVRGGQPLDGTVTVRGAKNLVSKAMVAALLGTTPSRLRNVPDVSDVGIVSSLLGLHGVAVGPGEEPGEIVMDPADVERADVADINAHAGSSRIPILLCGPLLHRLGRAFIPDLGGCRIGDRPIDFHLDALRRFGAVVDKAADGLHITAPDGLRGTKLALPYPSVGATEQMLLTAVLRRGRHGTGQRGRRAGDHGPDRHPAEDGRDHRGLHRPGDPGHRRARAAAATPTARCRTGSRPRPGPARRWPPAATSPSPAPGRPT